MISLGSSVFKWGLVVCTFIVLVSAVHINNLEDDDLDVNDRKGRILFPFVSVVRFANTECSGSGTMNGTCLTRRECNDLGGTNSGLCASKRGRCCVVSRSCGSITNVNNTYFVSPGYPAPYGGGASCTIQVYPCNPQICQLRIDFLDLVLAQPDGDGNCVTDSITITGGNTNVPVLCGDLTGQSVFVDFDGNTAITITVSASATVTFARRWNLKLTQLGCDCPGIAPNGCLQYHMGKTGIINSFNYGSGANQVQSTSGVTGTRQLVNLGYGICIRMEAGYCGITYSQVPGDPYSFTLSNDVEGADPSVLGTALGAENDGACNTDYVVVPSPFYTATGEAVGTDRFCGLGFRSVTTNLKPFVLYAVTSNNEGPTAQSPPDIANRGFSLQYTQVPC